MSDIKYPADVNAVRGKLTRAWAAKTVAAYRKRTNSQTESRLNGLETPAMDILIAGRDCVTPPLLDDRERGAGDSTNARLHRLIGKYRDFALVMNRDQEQTAADSFLIETEGPGTGSTELVMFLAHFFNLLRVLNQ